MRLSTSITAVMAMSVAMGTALAQGAAHAGSSTLSAPAWSAPSRACSDLVRIRAFSDDLDKKTLDGVYVGNLSALAVDRGGRITAVSDESYLYTLDVREKARSLSANAVAVAPLTDLNGAAPDSEGLAVDLDGSRLISSETEPSVTRYDRDGTAVEALPVPATLAVAPAGRAVRNQTFEGLTLQPGGRTLVASMEGALSGDERVWCGCRPGIAPGSVSPSRPAPSTATRPTRAWESSSSPRPVRAGCSSSNAASPPVSATPSASTWPTRAGPTT
ncbi:hypothetical protein GCM10023083_13010 [Streptomyces phyllanthi]